MAASRQPPRGEPVLIVVDASVLAQWIIPDEEICAGAERLMEDVGSKQVILLAPPLLTHEVANALSKAAKRGRIAVEDAALALRALSRLGILFGDPTRNDQATLRLSVLPSVTAYDAAYVALAEDNGCTFYTADKRLVAALCGHSDRVRLVAEYGETD